MEEAFWQSRWKSNQIGFHEGRPNDLLEAYFGRLGLKEGARIFVPLCGKAVDLDWLVSQGHTVVGAEFNRQAVEEVFARMGLKPTIHKQGALLQFSADGVDIFVGDVFELTAERLGPVDALYDRAALVALPRDTRAGYAQHMARITASAPQLTVTFEYEQDKMEGPPFAVPQDELRMIYGDAYEVSAIASRPADGPIAQRVVADERAWLLTPR